MVYLGKDSVFIADHQRGSATLFPLLEIERRQALYLRNNQAITATDVGREVNSLGRFYPLFLCEKFRARNPAESYLGRPLRPAISVRRGSGTPWRLAPAALGDGCLPDSRIK